MEDLGAISSWTKGAYASLGADIVAVAYLYAAVMQHLTVHRERVSGAFSKLADIVGRSQPREGMIPASE